MNFEDSSVNEEEDIPGNFESCITSNDLILERILYFMTFDDLLSSARINKRWNKLSRWELGRNRKCLAKIEKDLPCQDLLRLKEQFEGKSYIPYQGLSIGYSFGHANCKIVEDYRALESTEFWKTLPMKYLRVPLNQYTDCLAMQLLKLLMNQRSHEIQELVVPSLYYRIDDVPDFFDIERKIRPNWLPQLTSLGIGDIKDEWILLQLVAAAPSIRNIYGHVRPHHLYKLFEMRKAKLITEFICDPASPTDAYTLLRFAELKPKLQQLRIADRSADKEPWSSFAASLLESSSTSLYHLEIELLDLILLTSSEKLSLLHLKHLHIKFNDRLDKQLGFFVLSKINFDFLFPNLTSCKISRSSCESLYSQEQLELIPVELMQSNFVCSTVRQITLSDNCFNLWVESECRSVGSLFPNVTCFQIENCRQPGTYLKYTLAYWQNLESICISTVEYPAPITNFDVLFCGISKEEWTYLRSLEKTSPGFLQHVELVPSAWSLLHLKNLKSVKISVMHNDRCPVPRRDDFVLLSSLTGHLVFSKMSELTIDLVSSDCLSKAENACCLAFDDLRNFATISEIKDKRQR
ncbi:unnamed protein product [Allacma fusca]|uniref:F-box domain-containing protein n=1 Tax=Allacma fusca TaxID=39272 RepID=A0A8J2K560_9HEXA|nr:unnamed protein product [Allacma fusca]